MFVGKDVDMEQSAEGTAVYEPPRLEVLGSVAELTLYCDKQLGGSDGFTFMGASISCASV
jgi:hypothetical protein